MKVLVVGGGAREHALCWKLRQSPLLTELYCAPGNPGIAALADRVPLAAEEVQRLADFADRDEDRPDGGRPRAAAHPRARRRARARAASPSSAPRRRAAEIEGSKVFAKQFMERHGIPTAPFAVVHDAAAARAAARRFGFPVVLKADGLAAGKGVLIAARRGRARGGASRALFEERRFGASGDRVVVEAFLAGRRGLVHGPLATASGCCRSPPPATTSGSATATPAPTPAAWAPTARPGGLSAEAAAEVVETVLRPAVAGLAAEGRPFVGVLYAGLMLTPEGPRVLEFNARFGDPEAQVLLLRLEDDLLPRARRRAPPASFDARRALLPPRGRGVRRPGQPRLPRPAASRASRSAGSTAPRRWPASRSSTPAPRSPDGELVSAGGRVLSVCALAPDLAGGARAGLRRRRRGRLAGQGLPPRHRPARARSAEAGARGTVIPFRDQRIVRPY